MARLRQRLECQMKMEFALVDGQRRKPEPGLSGRCQVCSSPVISKCGERRIWHWAHLGERNCDHWWESETQWHRDWKNRFPSDWQEIVHRAESGEKHIADMKTAHGCVIEFQHSYLKPDERRARESFYKPMVWVVNGQRLKRDKPNFFKDLNAGALVGLKPLIFRTAIDRCSLLQTWTDSGVGVFFDFGVDQGDDLLGVPVLWRLNPEKINGDAVLSPVSVASFLDAYLSGKQLQGMYVPGIERVLGMRRGIPPGYPPPRPRAPLPGFARWQQRRRRARF